MSVDHEQFMQQALLQAKLARDMDEVPVGAVLVSATGEILAADHNRVITDCDPTAHAEILALRKAAKKGMNYRLTGTTLYATIEPCIMCMGAIIHARVKQVVFGAADPKWGACGSLYDFSRDSQLNHPVAVTGGICDVACREIIVQFFRGKRNGSGLLRIET
jgi:tRNA(adenine34) deaminase